MSRISPLNNPYQMNTFVDSMDKYDYNSYQADPYRPNYNTSPSPPVPDSNKWGGFMNTLSNAGGSAMGLLGEGFSFLKDMPEGIGNALLKSNPLTAGIGALTNLVGMIGSASVKKPNVSTNLSSYLDAGLSSQAAKFQDFNSDYYRKGEEGLRRTLMDAAPSSNSLLSLAAATAGSAAQANQQRKAAETKAMEAVNTGMSNLYQQGQDLGLKYTGLNWDQAGKSMQGNLDNAWSKYNADQAQWSQLSKFGSGMFGLGFPRPDKIMGNN